MGAGVTATVTCNHVRTCTLAPLLNPATMVRAHATRPPQHGCYPEQQLSAPRQLGNARLVPPISEDVADGVHHN